MKKLLLLVVTFASVSFGIESRTTLSGGVAIAVGDGSQSMNPGLTLCLEPIARVSKYFGIGGHLDYSWLTEQRPSGMPSSMEFSAGDHFWDISVVPKLYLPVSEKVLFCFDIDPGLYFGYAYLHLNGGSSSSSKQFFGMTYGVSLNASSFVFGFKFKNTFIDNDQTNWIAFSIGFLVY